MPNLIPGGKNLLNWQPVSGGLSIIPNSSPNGYSSFFINSAPFNYNGMKSPLFDVIPQGIYRLDAYLKDTGLAGNYCAWGLNSQSGTALGSFSNITGYGSVNVTIPAGVTQAYAEAYLQGAVVNPPGIYWSEPNVELVGFSISMTEASFSPIPFLSLWQQGSANIPVFSDGEYLYIPFVGGPGDPATAYEWYGVLKINATGWCAFVSSNTPNFTNASSVGGYGITFDGDKTFTYSNGNFFARFTVPNTFQASRVFRFAFAGTTPPANACGGTGYFSHIYSAGGKTILEYIQDFPLDSHIWAQVVESNLSADLGFVANGQSDPLFNPPISTATQGSLFPNPPLTYNSAGINVSFAPSSKYGNSISIMQSYTAALNASNSGSCTENKISIEIGTQGIVDCLDIATGSFANFALFGTPGLYAAYDTAYSTRFVMTADFSSFYYYSTNFPGVNYGPKGNGILNGELFTFANVNNGPIHVFTGTVPAFPAASKVVTRNALVLTNSTRPVSPFGAFKT